MTRFLDDARRILQAAERAQDPDVAILIQGRAIRIVMGKGDWPLESLLAESGASAAYRVSRSDGQVLVEGRSGPETCILKRRPELTAARELLADRRDYEIVNSLQCGSEARMLLT